MSLKQKKLECVVKDRNTTESKDVKFSQCYCDCGSSGQRSYYCRELKTLLIKADISLEAKVRKK